jgi:hypothetical protein
LRKPGIQDIAAPDTPSVGTGGTAKARSIGAFSLFDGPRKIGIGIKATDRTGYPRDFVGSSFGMCRDCSTHSKVLFLATALKYAIPRVEYRNYGILEP